MRLRHLVCATLLGILILNALPASAGDSDWLLRQADLEVARLTGELPADTRHFQDDFAGGTANVGTSSGRSPAVPMLLSLVLPGAGELYLGHKRGFIQIALDAASWYGAISNASKGSDKKDEYYAYADDHWFEPKLQAAYDTEWGPDRPYWNPDYDYMAGDGFDYFPDVTGGYTSLPLWVSKEADRREYYENLDEKRVDEILGGLK